MTVSDRKFIARCVSALCGIIFGSSRHYISIDMIFDELYEIYRYLNPEDK